jgi:hypothetical protein
MNQTIILPLHISACGFIKSKYFFSIVLRAINEELATVF